MTTSLSLLRIAEIDYQSKVRAKMDTNVETLQKKERTASESALLIKRKREVHEISARHLYLTPNALLSTGQTGIAYPDNKQS